MGSIRIVLMRPRNAENVGAIARAMVNFGLLDWVAVDPNPRVLQSKRAERMAVKAREQLTRLRSCHELKDAVPDCTWVVGTTMRSVPPFTKISPREVAQQAAQRTGTTALVFGDERYGLRNDDLAQCHALSSIPSLKEQPSLNLAQAVLLYCYELRLASLEHQPSKPAPRAQLATEGMLQALEGQLEELLTGAGFLRQRQAERALRALARPWHRGHLTRDEASLWNAALRVLGKRWT